MNEEDAIRLEWRVRQGRDEVKNLLRDAKAATKQGDKNTAKLLNDFADQVAALMDAIEKEVSAWRTANGQHTNIRPDDTV